MPTASDPVPPAARWIELEGAANVRDLGGLPLANGQLIAPRRLIRSDNLQGLTTADVRTLVDGFRVRSVADMRTTVEVRSEGPGPLTAHPSVRIVHASLYIENGPVTVRESDAGPVVLPWQDLPPSDRRSAGQIYLSYLMNRPDSVLAALRLIAHSDGATVVHCAAGKDRTGVIVALALDLVGVSREVIVADYARTAERLPALLARLAASPTYVSDITVDRPERHAPRPDTMRAFLDTLDAEHDGPAGWLGSQGWSGADQTALQAKLTQP